MSVLEAGQKQSLRVLHVYDKDEYFKHVRASCCKPEVVRTRLDWGDCQ